MGILIEDGTGIAGSNAYATEDEFDTYTDDRGITPADGDKEAALIRGSAALDAMYRGRFMGYRTRGRDQGLEWPRTAAYDSEWLPVTGVPIEVKNAVCEMAVRELESPGSMLPDLERGGQIQSLQAGSVRIDYGSNAQAVTTFQLIDGLMAPLLGAASSPFVGYAIRG